jgi:Ca2+-binding EF-hand superfamily protein
MLTYEQLSDLFRRLDRDGNGELDLEEFLQITNKLKLNATEDYISRWEG